MSDVMPRDILSELWKEILESQWRYMEAEESLKKLEERKILEGCLKELLCRVRQDRKFFLPETALVLKNSVCQQQEFSVNRAIGAFEAISHYANNLYSKPWRKEFRILKMYSGFYQHEIKSSLTDAEKLFSAMGYRSLSDDTLILDGPICPDQVSNVLRDAMSAYVELQIMKNIHLGLEASDIKVSWLDIYWYREKHVGGATQAIKDLISAAAEKLYRSNEKALAGDNYGYIDVQPSPNYNTPSPQCQCINPYHQSAITRQRMMANGPCCMHDLSHHNRKNLMFGNYLTQHPYHHPQATIMGSDSMGGHLPHMSHSRSLEHYSDPNHGQQHAMLPHRHSFDHQQQGCTANVHHQNHLPPHHRLNHTMQQQPFYHRNAAQNFYDPTYDCIDENSVGGDSSISYAAVASAMPSAALNRGAAGGSADVNCPSAMNYNINSTTYANPYNVSGNRFPLPYNISNQLSGYDNNSPHPHMVMDPNYTREMDNHMYAQIAKLPQNYITNGAVDVNHYSSVGKAHAKSTSNDIANRPNPYMSDELIDFQDHPIIPPPPASQFDPYHQQYPTYNDPTRGRRYGKSTGADINMSNNYATPHDHGKANNSSDMYVYAKPIPKECRQTQKNMQSSLRKTSFNSQRDRGTGDTTDLSYESANDDINDLSRQNQNSPTQFSKNQDGVGSFESWDFVFKNLERSGHTKNLGEEEDLLVKSLGLDSLNIANDSTTPSQTSSACDKRRSANYKENDNSSQIKQRSRVFEASDKIKNSTNPQPPTASSSSNTKQKPQTDNNKIKMKSALKQPSTGTIAKQTNSKAITTSTNKKNSNNDNKSKGTNYSNDNNNMRILENNKPNKKSSSANSSSTQSTVRKSTNSTLGAAAAPAAASSSSGASAAPTQIIVTGANEWSCQVCTFINSDKTRICEVCCRSKDFNLDATTTTTKTTAAAGQAAQTSVSHNTPTCV